VNSDYNIFLESLNSAYNEYKNKSYENFNGLEEYLKNRYKTEKKLEASSGCVSHIRPFPAMTDSPRNI
jgi:hypothetical protein